MQSAIQGLNVKTLEPDVTFLSASEIRVVILPVGEVPDAIFEQYASMIVRHCQVELNNVRSFYKESQKSPFKFFPWKTGYMHFRFLSENEALNPSLLASLHNHRRTLGVIGIMHCPSVSDVSAQYQQFEQRCRAFPDAFTVRCFAFDPTDEQITQDRKGQSNFIMFPPGDGDHLENHTEVVMHDFAACMLTALERWMLTASPAMVDLNSLIDSPEFNVGTPTPFVGEEDAVRTKRRYARLTKSMGDYSLLAGSPLDAQDHYTTATDLSRATGDWAFAAGAMEGYVSAKLLAAAIESDAFVTNSNSVFASESRWSQGGTTSTRTSMSHHEEGNDEEGENGGGRKGGPGSSGRSEEGGCESAESSDSNSLFSTEDDSPFATYQFWAALRTCTPDLEPELRALIEEARSAIRKRGALPMLMELDMMWSKLLMNLHGIAARKEVSDLISGVKLISESLPFVPDRLTALTQGALVLGNVGCARKKVLLMWQAAELSKQLGFPDVKTLNITRQALEPCLEPLDTATNANSSTGGNSSMQGAWSVVKTGCLEASLGLAIYAKHHTGVFDAAAALLRDHSSHLSTHRMQSLLENLIAASSQMDPEDKARPGPGPPPHLRLLGPRPPAPHLRPVTLKFTPFSSRNPAASSKDGGDDDGQGHSGPFLYDPFAAKRAAKQASQIAAAGPGYVCWVKDEVAVVDVEVSNPAAVGIKIERLVLEVEYLGPAPYTTAAHTPLPPSASPNKPHWKPKPVSLNIPANTKPVRIQLEGVPLAQGLYRLTGCRLTAFGGVSWVQPWLPAEPAPLAQFHSSVLNRSIGGVSAANLLPLASTTTPGPAAGSPGKGAHGGGGSQTPGSTTTKSSTIHVLDVVNVVAPLPKLEAVLHRPPTPTRQHQHQQQHQGEGALLGLTPALATSPRGGTSKSSLRLLQGMECHTMMSLRNIGSVPIHRITIQSNTLPASGGKEGISGISKQQHRSSTAHGAHHQKHHVKHGKGGAVASQRIVAVVEDEAALDGKLPLAPGQQIEVGVRWTVAGRPTLVQASQETHLPCEAVVEYVGPEGEPIAVAAAAASAMPKSEEESTSGNTNTNGEVQATGRRVALPVGVVIEPAVQISHIQFKEVYLSPIDSSPTTMTSSKDSSSVMEVERRCMMQVHVVNKGHRTLHTWLHPKHSSTGADNNNLSLSIPSPPLPAASAAEKSASLAVSSSTQLSAVLPPGKRGTIAVVLDRIAAAHHPYHHGHTASTASAPAGHTHAAHHNRSVSESTSLAAAGGGAGPSRADSTWSLSALGVGSIGAPSVRGGLGSLSPEDRLKREVAEYLVAGYQVRYCVVEAGQGSLQGNAGDHDSEPNEQGQQQHHHEKQEKDKEGDDKTAAALEGGGIVDLVVSEVESGLSHKALCMLKPASVAVKLTAHSLLAAGSDTSTKPSGPNDQVNQPLLDESSSASGNLLNEVSSLGSDGKQREEDEDASTAGDERQLSLVAHSPAVPAALGEILHISLTLHNHSTHRSVTITTSLTCKPIHDTLEHSNMNNNSNVVGTAFAPDTLSPASAAAAGHIGLTISVGGPNTAAHDGTTSITRTGLNPLGNNNPIELGMSTLPGLNGGSVPGCSSGVVAWTGVHTGLSVTVPPGGTVTKKAAVCVLYPGVYRVDAQSAMAGFEGASGVEEDDEERVILIDVEPCFIQVSAA